MLLASSVIIMTSCYTAFIYNSKLPLAIIFYTTTNNKNVYDTLYAYLKDKTQKLPELRHNGYGIRSEKLKNKPVKHMTPKPDRARAPEQQYEGHEKRYKPVWVTKIFNLPETYFHPSCWDELRLSHLSVV